MSENKEIGKANKKKSVLPILALILEFEWEDSKLYWRYTKDEVETYGGCYIAD